MYTYYTSYARAVYTSYVLCICAWTESIHFTCIVYLVEHLQRTLQLHGAVHDARKLYAVHQMHRSVKIQHTLHAYCSARGACSAYCAPAAFFSSLTTHCTCTLQCIKRVLFIFCNRCRTACFLYYTSHARCSAWCNWNT